MQNNIRSLFGLALYLLSFSACLPSRPADQNAAAHTYCDVAQNFCVTYPDTVFGRPPDGQDAAATILDLRSGSGQVRLYVAAEAGAIGLSYDQRYQQRLIDWETNFGSLRVRNSNITDQGYEVDAVSDKRRLYARAGRFRRGGDVIVMTLSAPAAVDPQFFSALKKDILLYPNE